MLKSKKLVAILCTLAIASSMFVGCGSKDSGKLVDGVYKVEFDNFDSHGYKPQLELTVAGNKITTVKYDEITKDGKFKSQDESYKKKMEEASKTYPEKAFKELQDKVVSKQGAEIDSVSGATASSNTFKTLAKYAVDEMAKKGNTTPGKVPVK